MADDPRLTDAISYCSEQADQDKLTSSNQKWQFIVEQARLGVQTAKNAKNNLIGKVRSG